MPEMPDPKNVILWIDLETTCLNPRAPEAQILEIAAVLTDSSLTVVDSLVRVMYFDDDQTRLLLDPYVQDMHTANGLWDLCKTQTHQPIDTQVDIIQMLRDNGVGPQQPYLGGSTINFDRAWIEVYMPLLFDFLHYRNIDMSTIKSLSKMWRPDISGDLLESAGIHRAYPDILETIQLAKFFKARLFDQEKDPHD